MYKTSGKLRNVLEKSPDYTSNWWRKTERHQHVAGWTWKHEDLNRLCPKPTAAFKSCSLCSRDAPDIDRSGKICSQTIESLDLAPINGDLGFHDSNKLGWGTLSASIFKWMHFSNVGGLPNSSSCIYNVNTWHTLLVYSTIFSPYILKHKPSSQVS